ncbi:MAG: hypothetical protein AAFV53_42125, partial [Myxococcota bacterium]
MIESIFPETVGNTFERSLTVTGENFFPNASTTRNGTLTFDNGFQAWLIDDESLSVGRFAVDVSGPTNDLFNELTLTMPGGDRIPQGVYDVLIETPGGRQAYLTDRLEVVEVYTDAVVAPSTVRVSINQPAEVGVALRLGTEAVEESLRIRATVTSEDGHPPVQFDSTLTGESVRQGQEDGEAWIEGVMFQGQATLSVHALVPGDYELKLASLDNRGYPKLDREDTIKLVFEDNPVENLQLAIEGGDDFIAGETKRAHLRLKGADDQLVSSPDPLRFRVIPECLSVGVDRILDPGDEQLITIPPSTPWVPIDLTFLIATEHCDKPVFRVELYDDGFSVAPEALTEPMWFDIGDVSPAEPSRLVLSPTGVESVTIG